MKIMVDGIVYIYTNNGRWNSVHLYKQTAPLCRQPPTHQTNIPMTNEPTNQPTTKKRALLEKLTDTSSHGVWEGGMKGVAHALWNLLR